MTILPLHSEIKAYCAKRKLTNKFLKQQKLFVQNPFHPSLQTELLEPKHMKIWSFRIDRSYRAIFIFRDSAVIEIIDVNNHCQ